MDSVFMNDLVKAIYKTLPFIALAIVGILVSAKVYVTLRKTIPTSVNCWFCNNWCKIPYLQRNSWICPNCEQYNGFTKDGHYNTIIPAQHDELLNPRIRKSTLKNISPAKNALCNVCNNNQQLKIHQLASFTPFDEKNYDVEVERFRRQLERAYRLCPKCENALKNTLQAQKMWMISENLRALRNHGLSLLNTSGTSITKLAKIKNIISSMTYTLCNFICLAIIIDSVYSKVNNFKLFHLKLPSVYETHVNNFLSVVGRVFSSISFDFSVVCMYGFGLQLIQTLVGVKKRLYQVAICLFWVIISVLPSEGELVLELKILWAIFIIACNIISHRLFKKIARKNQPKESAEIDAIEKVLDKEMSDLDTTARSSDPSFDSVECSSLRSSFTTSKSQYSAARSNAFSDSYNQSWRSLDTTAISTRSTSASVKTMNNSRPLLSPSRLGAMTQSSWVAGGFWTNPHSQPLTSPYATPLSGPLPLSRSSSQSSGFESQPESVRYKSAFASLPGSTANSIVDGDKLSIASEPLVRNRNPFSVRKENLRDPDYLIRTKNLSLN